MKKLIMLIAFAAISSASLAQQGTWYIGGTAGYSSDKDKAPSPSTATQTSSSWSFAPEAGTFLKDDIQLGFILGLGGSSFETDAGPVQTSSTMSPTAYVRKFFKVTDNFSVFTGLYLNYISGTDKDEISGDEDKTSGFGVKLGAGVAYALSPRFTAVGQYGVLGYQSTSSTFNGTDTGSSSSLDFGVNTVGTGSVFNIGLYYTFITK